MKKELIVSTFCTSLLLGCGHESSEVEDYFPPDVPVLKPEPELFTGNSVYFNEQDFVITVVDSERETHPIVVGDFSANEILLTHTGEFEGNLAKTKGITQVNNTGDYLVNDTIAVTGEVSENGIYIYGDINDQMVAYSLAKVSDSMNLASLVGTHTNPVEGTTWRIAIDGSFEINGSCIVNGTLRYNRYYFDVLEAEASNCADDSFNGAYEGMMTTVTYQSDVYLSGIIFNDTAVMWSTAVKQ